MTSINSDTSIRGQAESPSLAAEIAAATRKPEYAGDVVDPTATPIREAFQRLEIDDPAMLINMFGDRMAPDRGDVILYKWQTELLEELAAAKPNALKPYKFCLCAANGSGKDAFIVAPFAIWFVLTKIQSRVILTSSSGTQLTSQTETYIKNLAESVNRFFGEEVFRIRQRYIKCRLSGSEIRMFATDEEGKAEGYHPIVPGAEMAIVVNEGKSVSEEIHRALRRCTGYNYWLEVSTPGEPHGFFHFAFNNWPNKKRVTSYDCPRHLSLEELEADKIELGEHSALFRSKHLALFTSIGGEVIIPHDLVLKVRSSPPKYSIPSWPVRIGIDLAAGGDENCVTFVKGNRVLKEKFFTESDTTVTADRIERILLDEHIDKTHDYIYADDGGVGHSIIDMLKRRGWNIKRVLNQSTAINKKQFGNKGAENWYRIKRLFEELLIDITALSDKTIEQIGSRRYKQGLTGARIMLQKKSEAKSEGHPSPDRADALILAFTGLNIDDFLKARTSDTPNKIEVKEGDFVFPDAGEEYANWYRENVQYGSFNGVNVQRVLQSSGRVYNRLSDAMITDNE